MFEPLPTTSRYLRILCASLALGGIFDLALGALLLIAPELASRWLSLPLPEEAFYLRLIAVLLVMVAAMCLLAAYDPMAYAGNVLVAIAGRTAGGGVLAYAAATGGDGLGGLYPLAAVDLALAAAHALGWWPTRRLREQLL